jgi:hypothetical protein
MGDFISDKSDAGLVNLAEQFFNTLNGAPTVYGATAAQAADLDTKRKSYADELAAHLAAQSEARTQRAVKDERRDVLEEVLRDLARIAKAVPGITEAQLTALGIPAAGSAGQTPSTATRPAAQVDTSERFKHTINFTDEATPTNKRKPSGVVGAEIYAKIDGAPPVDYKQCAFIALDTATPYVIEYEAAEVGKMAHYMLRWLLKDGSHSGWSETASATITG